MNSNENISDDRIPMISLIRELKPAIVTKMNDISVIAPAVFKLNRKPVNIAAAISAVVVSSPM